MISLANVSPLGIREASVRREDRVIAQYGSSLGELEGCDVVRLSRKQARAISDAANTPEGFSALRLEPDGSITIIPQTQPPPRVRTLDELAYEAAVERVVAGRQTDQDIAAILRWAIPDIRERSRIRADNGGKA